MEQALNGETLFSLGPATPPTGSPPHLHSQMERRNDEGAGTQRSRRFSQASSPANTADRIAPPRLEESRAPVFAGAGERRTESAPEEAV